MARIDQKYKAELHKLLDAAKALRVPHERDIKEAYRYACPSRAYGNRIQPQPTDKLLDAIGLDTTIALKTNAIRLLMNPDAPFSEIVFREDDMKRQYSAQWADILEKANDTMFRHFQKSNFYLAVDDVLTDAVVSGTMCLGVMDEPTKLSYIAIPIDEIYLLENYLGEIDTVFRVHEMRTRELCSRFDTVPDRIKKTEDTKPDELHEIVERCIPEYGSKDGTKGKYHYCIHLEKGWERLQDEFTNWNPFICSRWERTLGSPYGNRPVRNALGNLRANHAIKRDILAYGHRAALGLYYSDDQAQNIRTMNGKMVAGSIIPLTKGATIEPFPMTGDFKLTFDMIELEHESIKRTMYDTSPPPAQQLQYMKAEAVVMMRDSFHQKVGEPALRLSHEFLQPIADQILGRLVQRGDVQLITPELAASMRIAPYQAERMFICDITAAVQRSLSIQQANNTLLAVGRAMQVFGPEVLFHLDQSRMIRSVLEGLGVSTTDMVSEAEAAKVKKAAMEMQAQQQQAEMLQKAGLPGAAMQDLAEPPQ